MNTAMDALLYASAKNMARQIREKRVSAFELTSALIARIERVNPRINAIVQLNAEQALALARKADEQLARGEPLGPFHGVAMTVKGAWDCQGLINSGGTLGRRHLVAQQDATVIARMKRAGAIPLAVTNLPELSLAFESDNLIYGRSLNPYRLDRTPGGSGGGGAAAIAAGCSPFEVGGDMGGSIRVPSHFCGIAGLKTTLGRVPLTGYFPGPFGVPTLMATAGPMARYVEDLIETLPLLSGPDSSDANVAPVPVEAPAQVRLKQLRVAFHTHNGLYPCTPETVEVIERAAQALQSEVALIEPVQPERLEEGLEIALGLLFMDGGQGVRLLALSAGTTELSPLLQQTLRLLENRAADGAAISLLLARRDQFRMRVHAFFERYDVILCPACAFAALPHGQSLEHLAGFSYTFVHNLSGCPAVVVRCGTSPEGLPIGVQVVSAPWCEHIGLAVAARLEEIFGGFQPPPPL